MALLIDLIVSGSTPGEVNEVLDQLDEQIRSVEKVATEREDASVSSGLAETGAAGALVLTVMGQVAIGIVANTIYSWLSARMRGRTQRIEIVPGAEPVRIELDGTAVTIIVRPEEQAGVSE
ncbi:MAG: hypothetical protein AAF809_10190 [Bacteroidota bacterium]